MNRQTETWIRSLFLLGLGFLFLISLAKPAKAWRSTVIYDQDDRRDLFETEEPLALELARSTAAILDKKNIRPVSKDRVELRGESLGSSEGLCPGEKFRAQLTPAFCSGVLIGKDELLTARHCLDDAEDGCDHLRIVFGWGIRDVGQSPYLLNKNEIYRCKRVLESESTGKGVDYAIIQLDRPVREVPRPLRISEADPKIDQEVLLLGHPLGMPMKVDAGGAISDVYRNSFQARVDAFSGSSGSPVFDRRTGELLGILVEGEQDFEDEKKHSCKRLRFCEEGECSGETVTRVSAISWLWAGNRIEAQNAGMRRLR